MKRRMGMGTAPFFPFSIPCTLSYNLSRAGKADASGTRPGRCAIAGADGLTKTGLCGGVDRSIESWQAGGTVGDVLGQNAPEPAFRVNLLSPI